jgi:itaconyl-CoA hydratase
MSSGSTKSEVNEARLLAFEDLEVGRIYAHRYGRTVTEADNIWITLITLGINQIHFNGHYASKTRFGRPILASPFTLAVVTGLSATDFGETTVANLGWTDVMLPKPVFVGDTIYARTRILAKRPSNSRPEVGIVELKTEGFNQDGDVVITFSRKLMMSRRGHIPALNMPAPKHSTL